MHAKLAYGALEQETVFLKQLEPATTSNLGKLCFEKRFELKSNCPRSPPLKRPRHLGLLILIGFYAAVSERFGNVDTPNSIHPV